MAFISVIRVISGLLGSIELSKLLETKNPGIATRVFIYNFIIYNLQLSIYKLSIVN